MLSAKEMLCDRCLAEFEWCLGNGRPNDFEACKKCAAKINAFVEEGLKGYKPEESE